MSTDWDIQELLKLQLMQFLRHYGFVTYDESTPGSRWCILMGTTIMEEMFQFFLNYTVQAWIEEDITTMTDFIYLRDMKLWEIVIMVKEDVEKGFAAMVEHTEGL
ncbi:hypothetical protein BGX38DRAFT_1142768 [Terfezia claveryi]|nr:hypothetical protein BGX38DRAFT_1142768 [Terfezia claveryi]